MRREGCKHSGHLGGFRGGGESRAETLTREDGTVKTRTLMLLALVTGVAILIAGTLQIFMAR